MAKLDNDDLKAIKDLMEVTEEDTYVNSMMVALLLFEARDRHYKPNNQ